MKKTNKKKKVSLPKFTRNRIGNDFSFLEKNKNSIMWALVGLMLIAIVGIWSDFSFDQQASLLRQQSYHSAAFEDTTYVCAGDLANLSVGVQGDVVPEEAQLKIKFLPESLEFVSLETTGTWERAYSNVSAEDGFLYFVFRPKAVAGMGQNTKIGDLVFKVKEEGKAQLEFVEVRTKDAIAVQKDQYFKFGESCPQ